MNFISADADNDAGASATAATGTASNLCRTTVLLWLPTATDICSHTPARQWVEEGGAAREKLWVDYTIQGSFTSKVHRRRKTLLILFEFLIFPLSLLVSVRIHSHSPQLSPKISFRSSFPAVIHGFVLCRSIKYSLFFSTLDFCFSYLCLLYLMCVILKVKNIKFSSVPPLIFLQCSSRSCAHFFCSPH